MKNGDPTLALVGVAICGSAVAAIIAYGHWRDTVKRAQMAKDDPLITPIGMFPALKPGDVVLVDPVAANIPAPFNAAATVPCVVDMVLQDPLLVSVKTPPVPVPGVATFGGTIPRSAIKQVLMAPSLPTVFT